MKKYTFLLLCALMASGGATVNAQLSIGYYKFKDGAEYTGELKGKKPNGKGRTVFPNGDVYEGEYLKGKREGEGTYTFKDGEKYVGQWMEDQQHGKG
ncbi:MAG: phosphatidylinositol-4-phosphate 5-kinase, partial [Bacteroidales bacterium]|nr:phosphatidylinositol-4-phosphate 5-kinase [Bacteroidales bacterium]